MLNVYWVVNVSHCTKCLIGMILFNISIIIWLLEMSKLNVTVFKKLPKIKESARGRDRF